MAVAVSVSFRLRSPSGTLPDIAAADTVVPAAVPSPSVLVIPAEELEEIINAGLPDSVYYFPK